jgi:hypothetical protein
MSYNLGAKNKQFRHTREILQYKLISKISFLMALVIQIARD